MAGAGKGEPGAMESLAEQEAEPGQVRVRFPCGHAAIFDSSGTRCPGRCVSGGDRHKQTLPNAPFQDP